MDPRDDILLEVEDLRTYFYVDGQEIRAVDGASFTMKRGQILAIVGESGCGKSVTAYSILRLIQKPGKIVGGKIRLHTAEGETIDITALSEKSETLYDVRGGLCSMIFQEPMTALSPVHTIGNQICEAILLHQNVTRAEAESIAEKMLSKVGIPGAASRADDYPHQFSGGMRQRVMIAMGLSCNPQLLIADEPTTALDVTIQAQIIDLVKRLQDSLGMAIIWITHDLGIVAGLVDRMVVMYSGYVVESANVNDVYGDPRHPYTLGLLRSIPRLDAGVKEKLIPIEGLPPDLLNPPKGCPFEPRCGYRIERCREEPPKLREAEDGHRVACWVDVKEVA